MASCIDCYIPLHFSHSPQEKWGYEHVIMVGDGATDMEARLEGVASLFIG